MDLPVKLGLARAAHGISPASLAQAYSDWLTHLAVSPWPSVYRIQRLVSAPVSFLLTSGGHNVGIVNPAAGPLVHPRASYRFATHGRGAAPADPRSWQAAAPSFEGSWWPRWRQWLHAHSRGRVKAKPAAGGIEAAPGTYVHQR